MRESRGGGDALWGSGDGPLVVLLGSSCGPGLEEPQVQAVRMMVTAPPSNGAAACRGAEGGAEQLLSTAGLRLRRGRRRAGLCDAFRLCVSSATSLQGSSSLFY